MSRKDISDLIICHAYVAAATAPNLIWPDSYLMEWTGQVQKVCYRAMERAHNRGFIDYGVSLRSGWVTEKGHKLLAECAL